MLDLLVSGLEVRCCPSRLWVTHREATRKEFIESRGEETGAWRGEVPRED